MVGFNAVLTSEHFASFLVFGILHAALAIAYIKARALVAQHSSWWLNFFHGCFTKPQYANVIGVHLFSVPL